MVFKLSVKVPGVHLIRPWALPTLPVLTWVLCNLWLLFHLKAQR